MSSSSAIPPRCAPARLLPRVTTYTLLLLLFLVKCRQLLLTDCSRSSDSHRSSREAYVMYCSPGPSRPTTDRASQSSGMISCMTEGGVVSLIMHIHAYYDYIDQRLPSCTFKYLHLCSFPPISHLFLTFRQDSDTIVFIFK